MFNSLIENSKILNRETRVAKKNLIHSVTFSSETAPCDAACETISDEQVTE